MSLLPRQKLRSSAAGVGAGRYWAFFLIRQLRGCKCGAVEDVALAEEKGISLRQAALVAGINEVAAALKARGIYP